MIIMIGGYKENYYLILMGRVIFGLGGESMGVAQSAIVSLWFKNKELAFALGINLTVSRLGSVANAAIVPGVYNSNGLGAACMVGFMLCIFSLINAIGLVYLDKKAEKLDPNFKN